MINYEKMECTDKPFMEIYKGLSKNAQKYLDRDKFCDIEEFAVENDVYYHIEPSGVNPCELTFKEMDEFLAELWEKEHSFAVEVTTEKGKFRFPETGFYTLEHPVHDDSVYLSTILEMTDVRMIIGNQTIGNIRLLTYKGEFEQDIDLKKSKWIVLVHGPHSFEVEEIFAPEFRAKKYLVDKCFEMGKYCGYKEMHQEHIFGRSTKSGWIEIDFNRGAIQGQIIENDVFAQAYKKVDEFGLQEKVKPEKKTEPYHPSVTSDGPSLDISSDDLPF